MTLALVILLVLSIFFYIKHVKASKRKGNGWFKTYIVSGLLVSFLFVILFCIVAVINNPNGIQEKSNVSNNVRSGDESEQQEVATDQEIKDGIDKFFTSYLSYSNTDTNIYFDDFNNKVKYLFKTTDNEVDYTNKRKAYAYELSTGIKMVVMVNKQSNRINYVGMAYNSHEGGSLESYVKSCIHISMILQGTTNPYDVTPFLTKLVESDDGDATLGENEYRVHNKNGVYLFMIRKG